MFHDQGDVTIPAYLTCRVNLKFMKSLAFYLLLFSVLAFYFSGNNTCTLSLFWRADIYFVVSLAI